MGDSKGRKLWGKKFDVVEEGLDESQIAEFVDELIRERDTLLEQRDSLLSYIKLSKGTVEREDKQTGSSGQQAENREAGIVTEVEQDIQPEMETTELEQAMQPMLPEAMQAMEEGGEESSLYQGELELAILPPVDEDGLLQFERGLLESFQLKILSTDGSPSKGSLIIVQIGEPQSFLQGLKQMPEVEEAVEELGTSSQVTGVPPWRFRSKQERRILVTLSKG